MSNLEECHKVAAKRKGKCLSNEYVNQKEKIKWQCLKNHIWEAPLYKIKHHDSWCPICSVEKKRVSILDAHEIAKIFEGKCLSNVMKDSRTKIKWSCKRDHQWIASYWEVSQKRWCKRCNIIDKALNKIY